MSLNTLDLTEEELKTQIVNPYLKSESFLFKGRPIDPLDIESIQIYWTRYESKKYLYFITEEYDMFANEGSIWKYIPRIGKDVTSDFITSLPKQAKAVKDVRQSVTQSKNVFIVHGRDRKSVKELKSMLKEFGLNPIVLHEQPSGSRTIVEKLEKYSDVGYAFVILTPDDVGCSKEEYWTAWREGGHVSYNQLMIDLHDAVNKRARQNVVLEFGYFMGKLERDRVCCLHKGDVELPSDMHGIVYIPFKESVNEIRDKIIKELKAVGYKIKI